MSSFRVFTAEWCHETNTFSKIPTNLDSFHAQYYLKGPDEIEKERKGTKTTLGATYEAAEKYNWQLTTTIVASANPAGALEKATFETMVGEILEPLHQGKQFDGVLLHLHGAMVTEQYEDAEGELLRRVRDLVGPDVPVMVTLDLHGNITSTMAQHANLLLAVRTYPHIDFYETAQRTADFLQLAMTRQINPRTVIAKRPMLRGLDGGKTHPQSTMTEIIRRAIEYEDRHACLVVSICAGFMAADIYEIGPSVTVTVDMLEEGAMERGTAIAEALMDFAWETRDYTSEHHYSIPEAVAKAYEYAKCAGQDRLVMAEMRLPYTAVFSVFPVLKDWTFVVRKTWPVRAGKAYLGREEVVLPGGKPCA
ncbi:M81 family peptidase, partial [archaeon]